ncbi:MAG TPA: zf-HC2 domain-containing protein [Candidatus Methanoperedens sp.]|nr:zf-HC2 domain-containing protein [Candidatus Methanoperedens sp.]
MLSCRDVDLLLQDHLDGSLLRSQEEVLERHLLACASCRATLEGLARIDARLEGQCDVEVPRNLSGRILAALPADTYRVSPLGRAVRWAAGAAMVAVLLAAALFVKGNYDLRSLIVERELEVSFRAPAATSVAVVGDFNGWDPRRNLMVRSSREGLWGARLRLPPGVYQYSFVIDGKVWEADPQARRFIDDGFGGRNSVIIVDG